MYLISHLLKYLLIVTTQTQSAVGFDIQPPEVLDEHYKTQQDKEPTTATTLTITTAISTTT